MLAVEPFQNTINVCKDATEIAINKDLLWIISLSRKDDFPMWLGFNYMISTDNSEVKKIDYLAPINNSPTSYAVVNETLVMATETDNKCESEFIIDTYDLGIAKMAKQLQESEKSKFDKIFVNLGSFHMQITFFKATGKFVHSSGLIEAQKFRQKFC